MDQLLRVAGRRLQLLRDVVRRPSLEVVEAQRFAALRLHVAAVGTAAFAAENLAREQILILAMAVAMKIFLQEVCDKLSDMDAGWLK